MIRKRGAFGAVALFSVVGLALSACGSSVSSTSSGGSGSTAAATKAALPFFFINAQGSSTGHSYPNETSGAQAAVKYINDHGGVGGHPIKLQTCFTDESTAATTTCANEAVAANPLAVTIGTVSDDNDIINVTGKTDIPIVANSAFTSATLTAKGKAFIFDSPDFAGDVADAQYAVANGAKKAAIVYVNVTAVTTGTLPAAEAVLKNAGVAYQGYPVPYPSPDLTPTIQAIKSSGADALILQADPTTCGAAYQAAATLSFTGPIYSPNVCNTPSNDSLVSALSQKSYVQTISVPLTDTSNADVKIYNAATQADGLSTTVAQSAFTIDGFQDMWGIYEALKAASTPTRAGLIKALQTHQLHEFLLGQGTTFQCNGTAVPASPALCSLSTLMGQWKGTTVTNVQAIDAAKYLK